MDVDPSRSSWTYPYNMLARLYSLIEVEVEVSYYCECPPEAVLTYIVFYLGL
jgi:hypothetical protein